MTIFLSLFFLFIIELLYFKVADHYNIIDRPNNRSSHSTNTIRGGGIIFCIAILLFSFSNNFAYPWFVIGLVLLAIISFLDDLLTLRNTLRFSIHICSVGLLSYQLGLFSQPWYVLFLIAFFAIGVINAYNFMDGVNGITGAYSLLMIGTLIYINLEVVAFTNNTLLIMTGLSLLVFNFFNFRIKAKCFAGDVGSVSIAFILIFLVGQLILKTTNFTYILLLLFYGLDVVTTIAFRLIRKENIFEAHRSHFYQYLANDRNWPHLKVSVLYLVVQLLINLLLLFFIKDSLMLSVLLLVIAIVVFLSIRFYFEGKKRLMN